MRKIFRKLAAAGLAICMTTSLAACGGGQEGSTAQQTAYSKKSEETTAAGSTESAAETLAEETFSLEQPEGWTEKDATESIVYQMTSSINTLDKWSQSTQNPNFELDYLVFDGLLSKDDEGNTIPWVAKEWEMAEDYSSITFHLRDDVYFTNGELLTADDVIFSLERLRDDKEHLPDSVVKGWRNYIGELEKIDDFNLTLHFAAPMPEFWTMVNVPDTLIVCKSAYESTPYEEFWQNPVGSGPYVVTSFDGANSVVELELRTDEHGYWGYDYANRYTNVKHITMKQSVEATTRVSSLRTGEANIVNGIPTSDVEPLKSEGYYIHEVVPASYVYLQTACGEGDLFSNRDLREALSLCIDRGLIVQALLDGYGIPCMYPCLEHDLGYRENLTYQYDVERAKELVANSGYNGEPIRFIYSTSVVSIGTELCQAIQSMANSVGFNVEVVPLETAVYNEARSSRDFDIILSSIGKSGNMWYKTAAEGIGEDRFNTGFQNEELKKLGKQMAAEMDQEKQDELLAQMYEIELAEFEPNIYLYWPTELYAWKDSIKGISFHGHKISDMRAMVVTE